MKQDDLRTLILSFTQDIILGYGNEDIFINPWNEKKFVFGYKDIDKTYDNIDALMNDRVIDGKSLVEICEQVEVL